MSNYPYGLTVTFKFCLRDLANLGNNCQDVYEFCAYDIKDDDVKTVWKTTIRGKEKTVCMAINVARLNEKSLYKLRKSICDHFDLMFSIAPIQISELPTIHDDTTDYSYEEDDNADYD